MTYLGSSFAIPSLLAFLTFFAWTLVYSRMGNLKLHWGFRVTVFVGALMILALAVIDVSVAHKFASEGAAIGVVVVKSVLWVVFAAIGVVIYRLLGERYPERMRASHHEENPKPKGAKCR